MTAVPSTGIEVFGDDVNAAHKDQLSVILYVLWCIDDRSQRSQSQCVQPFPV